MKHEMRLHNDPFNKIKNGTKKIEMRLLDEKRKLINVNDTIEFENRVTNEKLLTIVEGLYKFDNFEELYKHFDKVSLGYDENEKANFTDLEEYYSKEEQKEYGVVGIKIKVLK